jgi:hypothetical protein
MNLIFALCGIALLIIVLLIAVKIGINKAKAEEELPDPLIHASGIYSIVRKSPRSSIADYKPSQEEIQKYLSDKNVNKIPDKLSKAEQDALIKQWNDLMEHNLAEVEDGDKKGVEFYLFDYEQDDPVCKRFIPKGRFVTRSELYQYPNVIPPLHIGCSCRLKQYQGKEKLHDTTILGMLPLLGNGATPPLPDWKEVHLG